MSRTISIPIEHAEALRDFIDSATASSMTRSREQRALLRKAYGSLVLAVNVERIREKTESEASTRTSE